MKPLKQKLTSRTGLSMALAAIGLSAASTSTMAQAEWEDLTNASLEKRSEFLGLQIDDSYYFFYGFECRSSGTLLINETAERYNFASNTWEYLEDYPVFGDVEDPSNTDRTYNTEDCSGNDRGIPTGLTHAGIAEVDGRVWIVGGRLSNDPGTVVDQVLIYDPELKGSPDGAWIRGPKTPHPVAGGGLVRLGSKLHWIGGVDKNAIQDVHAHFTFDIDQIDWDLDRADLEETFAEMDADSNIGWQTIAYVTDVNESAAELPSFRRRNHFGLVAAEGKIYMIGGQFGHDGPTDYKRYDWENSDPDSIVIDAPGTGQNTNLVDVYDPATGEWSPLEPFPIRQSHMETGVFAVDEKIFVFGGQNNNPRGSQILYTSYYYNIEANTWNRLENLNVRDIKRNDTETENSIIATAAALYTPAGNTQEHLYMMKGGYNGNTTYSSNLMVRTPFTDTIADIETKIFELGFHPLGETNIDATRGGPTGKLETILYSTRGRTGYELRLVPDITDLGFTYDGIQFSSGEGEAFQSHEEIHITVDPDKFAPGVYPFTLYADAEDYTNTEPLTFTITVTGSNPAKDLFFTPYFESEINVTEGDDSFSITADLSTTFGSVGYELSLVSDQETAGISLRSNSGTVDTAGETIMIDIDPNAMTADEYEVTLEAIADGYEGAIHKFTVTVGPREMTVFTLEAENPADTTVNSGRQGEFDGATFMQAKNLLTGLNFRLDWKHTPDKSRLVDLEFRIKASRGLVSYGRMGLNINGERVRSIASSDSTNWTTITVRNVELGAAENTISLVDLALFRSLDVDYLKITYID